MQVAHLPKFVLIPVMQKSLRENVLMTMKVIQRVSRRKTMYRICLLLQRRSALCWSPTSARYHHIQIVFAPINKYSEFFLECHFLLPFLRFIFIYLVSHHCKLLLNHFYTYFRYHWLCNNSLENLSVRSLHHPSPGKWDLGH